MTSQTGHGGGPDSNMGFVLIPGAYIASSLDHEKARSRWQVFTHSILLNRLALPGDSRTIPED